MQNFLVDAGVNVLRKNNKNKLSLITLSRITLTNNEITDIAKVISSLENRGILLKKLPEKIGFLKGGFLHFLRPLMSVGL